MNSQNTSVQRQGYTQQGFRPRSRPVIEQQQNAVENGSIVTEAQQGSPAIYGSTTGSGVMGRPNSYEEFFGGSMQCPSCRGTGRISRESDNELVALIPVRDKRLRPRRTYLYVILSIAICCTITGLLVFFLYPRGFSVVTDSDILIPSTLYINKTVGIVRMTVINKYNISNPNFFPMEVTKLSGQVFFDQRIMSNSENDTTLHIPMRSMKQHYLTFNLTFEGDEGYIAYYCNQGPRFGHTLLMPFETKLETNCMGRFEELSVDTYEHVKCSKKYETTTVPASRIITTPHHTPIHQLTFGPTSNPT